MLQTQTYDDPQVLDPAIRARWSFLETGSASAILRSVCPGEWADIIDVLRTYQLDPSTWLKAGGNRGDVAQEIDGMFGAKGWSEIRIDIETKGLLFKKGGQQVGSLPPVHQEGYLVDNFKGRVALDVEWNAKDGNLDRDLAAYRSWFEAGVISAAVLITKDQSSLLKLAQRLWADYQATLPAAQQDPKLPIDLKTSTVTCLEKADLRIRRGVQGTCPLLVVAANDATWNGLPFIP
jgi:hypothetical protein